MRLAAGWLMALAFVASAATQEIRSAGRASHGQASFENVSVLPAFAAHMPTAVLQAAGADRPAPERHEAAAVPGATLHRASLSHDDTRALAALQGTLPPSPFRGRAPPAV